MERDASQAGPAEDANVVGIGQRVDRVVDDRKNQVVQNLDDAGRRRELRIGDIATLALRPGMEGQARITAGEASLLSLWTRKAVNKLRLLMWRWL